MNDHTFRIGENALLLPPGSIGVSLISPSYAGTEVTVQSELTPIRELTRLNVCAEDGYIVELSDGRLAWVVPELLQKLPPSDPGFVKWRDALVREFAMDAPVVAKHPAIVSMLEFVGQSPLQTAREALAK